MFVVINMHSTYLFVGFRPVLSHIYSQPTLYIFIICSETNYKYIKNCLNSNSKPELIRS